MDDQKLKERLEWFHQLKLQQNAHFLDVAEWKDENWRVNDGGFMGRDFIHSAQAAVRIFDYVMLPASASAENASTPTSDDQSTLFPRLVGPAHFTERSESHKGKCHGGSFCALMDDAIGWMGFCVSGECKPWCGYTVQVNTSLRKSVPVHSVLKIEAWVKRKEGSRKFWIGARLSDPHDTDTVYCDGEGLFLLSAEEAAAMLSQSQAASRVNLAQLAAADA